MPKPKILAFAGSTRSGSLNKMLARTAAEIASNQGADAEFLDLAELAIPLFDEDLEKAAGMPDGAKRLKAKIAGADGLLIASPEYNSSVTAALKNAIDWASRAERDDEPPLSAFRGKWAALLSASPGGLGGLRGLVHLRAILGNIGVHVIPDQLAIPAAHDAIAPDGTLADPKKAAALESLVKTFVALLEKVR